MNLPKVLIVGQTFNKKSGGGITQSNLFSGWDKNKLAVACTHHLLIDSDTSICCNYYQLGDKEHKWIFPFNLLQRKFPSGPLKSKEDSIIQKQSNPKNSIRQKLVDNYFFPFLKYTGLYHCISKIRLSPDFCDWINTFNPDIIYAQAQDRERILFSISLHAYLKKPLIFHNMDDWQSTVSNKGPLKHFWKRKIDFDFRVLMNRASLLMGISDVMAEEYKIRYNKNFITFHNPIDVNFWKKYQKTDYEISNSPIILYAGRIGLGIDASLETIAKSIQSVNEQLNLGIKFILQTVDKPEWINKYLCVEHRTLVAYNSLPRIFAESDFLILPYDFSKKSLNYIQFSMPTKAPEYMISGTPILIFAPEATALVKYARKYNCAKIVINNNVQELSDSIRELIQNKALRERISRNAKRIAEERHNLIDISNDFKNAICSVANFQLYDTFEKK